jgi:fused signal recognition particle receptor
MFNFLKKIFSPFAKMKSELGQKIRALFSGKIDESSYSHLEQLLYEADLGPSIAGLLIEKLKTHLKINKDPETIIPFLKSELYQLFPKIQLPEITSSPHVIMIVGVNGSGKTTTVAKLASYYKKLGKKVLIAAGDTFRAAAVEQLVAWANKIKVDIVQSQTTTDPSAIAFDALASAKARGFDVVLIDTAGRLQNKTDLMQELAKLRRICQKQIPNSPHETLLVVDGTVGQNAIDQAKIFHKFTPITGLILTKLDGTAKGGIGVLIQKELGLPILWVGLGEGEEDFIPFDLDQYINALLKE